GGYDHYAVVKGDDGVFRRYAYHGQTLVQRGQRVGQGQPLGIIARRHLHYEEIHPTLPDGRPNPVWEEFNRNGNANTSYQRGTADPWGAGGLNIPYGTPVKAGVPFRGPQTPEEKAAAVPTTPRQEYQPKFTPKPDDDDTAAPSPWRRHNIPITVRIRGPRGVR